MSDRQGKDSGVNAFRHDALVVLGYFIGGIVAWLIGIAPLWRGAALIETGRWSFLVTLAAISIVALLRTRAPFIGLGLGAIAAAVDLACGGSLGVLALFTDMVYTTVKIGAPQRLRYVLWAVLVAAAGLVIWLVTAPPAEPMTAIVIVQFALVTAFAAAWGWDVRTARTRTREAMAAEHLRSAQQLRTRIAHDLHDLVANQIAVAGLHVEAARLHLANEAALGQADESLQRARAGTSEAHRQLRRLITVLTMVDDVSESELTPAAAVTSITQLAPSGRDIVWRNDSDRRLVTLLENHPPTHAAVLVRALRELVTNAIKHGCGDVTIDLSSQPESTDIVMTNTIRADRHGDGSGIGISGVQMLLSGTETSVESAPSEDGQWRAMLKVGRDDATAIEEEAP